MKKTINRKSYNTEYDSEFICKYDERCDGWAYTRHWIYKKKSTGEYFVYSKWGQWNDSWDIKLVSEEEVKEVVKEVNSGMTHKYCAVLEDFPETKGRGFFWGKEDDDPWIKVKEKEEKDIEEKKKKGIPVIKQTERCEVCYLYDERDDKPTGEVYIFFSDEDCDYYFEFVVKCDCETAYKTMVECLYNYGYPECDLNNKYESLLGQPAVKEFVKRMGCTPYPYKDIEGIEYQYYDDSLEKEDLEEIYRKLSHKR